MITETKITGNFMGLNYEIGSQPNGGSWYSVYDVGKVTNKRLEIASGSASADNKPYTVEYVEKVIASTMENL